MADRKRTCSKRNWTTSKGEKRTAWVVDFSDASGQRCRRQFDTKRDADDFRIGTETQLRSGTFRADAAKVSVKDATTIYLKYCDGRHTRHEKMTRTNLVDYKGTAKNHLLHPAHGIGAVTLAQLPASKVNAFRDRLRASGVSVAVTRKALSLLKRVLDHAIGQDIIAVNAASGVKVIGRRDEGSKKVTPPPKADMKTVLVAADPALRFIMLFAATVGVRAGELWALRWKHIDFVGSAVSVETRVDMYGDEDTTKTSAGIRTIPLGEATLRGLKTWRLKSKFSKDSDLIFPSSVGGYTSHTNFLKRRYHPVFASLEKEHRLDPEKTPPAPTRFHWHALRHYAVSTWIEAGLPPKTVQTFVGHATLQMTMDTYGHMFPSEDHKTAMDSLAADLAI